MCFNHTGRPRSTVLLLFTYTILMGGCFSIPKTESTEDLGHGFHHDVIAERTANSSESIGHFDYLFYRNQRLSRSRKFAVASSGRGIVYQEEPSGNIFVFHRDQRAFKQLTSTFPGIIERFDWDKAEQQITANFVDQGGVVYKRQFPIGD